MLPLSLKYEPGTMQKNIYLGKYYMIKKQKAVITSNKIFYYLSPKSWPCTRYFFMESDI